MFEYEQDGEETTGMKQLRQALEKANAALKVRDDELAKIQGQVRTQSVREILRDLGVKPKVADLIPSAIEPTADAVGKWVKDYEDVFGAALRSEEKSTDSESETVPAELARPSVDEQTVNAFARLNTLEGGSGVVPQDIEQSQIAALAAIEKAANGDRSKLMDIFTGRASIT